MGRPSKKGRFILWPECDHPKYIETLDSLRWWYVSLACSFLNINVRSQDPTYQELGPDQ